MTGPLRWRAEALVLLVEVRTCERCGQSYRSPGGLFVRMESQIGDYHRTWLIPPKDVTVTSFLRHEKREVHTPVPVCELCYIATPEHQLTFWPEKFQPNIAYSARIAQIEAEANARLMNGSPMTAKSRAKAAKPPAKPLTLADL